MFIHILFIIFISTNIIDASINKFHVGANQTHIIYVSHECWSGLTCPPLFVSKHASDSFTILLLDHFPTPSSPCFLKGSKISQICPSLYSFFIDRVIVLQKVLECIRLQTTIRIIHFLQTFIRIFSKTSNTQHHPRQL